MIVLIGTKDGSVLVKKGLGSPAEMFAVVVGISRICMMRKFRGVLEKSTYISEGLMYANISLHGLKEKLVVCARSRRFMSGSILTYWTNKDTRDIYVAREQVEV